MTTTQSVKAQNTSALNEEQKHIITVAAFTASGDIDALKAEFPKALEAGLTVNEIKEILIQMYAYAGFPRSLNGIDAFIEILEQRKEQGITDTQGKEATPIASSTNMEERGNTTRNELVGMDLSNNQASWAVFAPVIDEYLKAHLFGAIFSRDVLNHQERELATIGALAAMKGTESQLGSHLFMSTKVGLSEEQLRDFVIVIRENLGEEKAKTAETLLNKLMSQ